MGRATCNKKKVASNDASFLLQKMPLAHAVYSQDTVALSQALEQALPKVAGQIQVNNLEQSLGQAFTGGRSTPVYYVQATVQRTNGSTVSRSFCIKLILLPDDPHNTASILHKRESYAVEHRFYQTVAPRLLLSSIPRLLASEQDGRRPPAALCLVMNDLRTSFPHQPQSLYNSQARAALQWLARFHASGWGFHNNNNESWRGQLWKRGGFYTQDDTNDDDKSKQIISNWIQSIQWIQTKHPQYLSGQSKSVGQRMVAAMAPIVRHLEAEAQGPRGTLVHGDFKAANMFFSSDNNDECSDCDAADFVAVVDFQYAGGGLVSQDVAYLLFPDAHGHLFDEEHQLLQVYHEEMIQQLMLAGRGGPSSLTWEAFCISYELARVQLIGYWLRRGWVASTLGDAILVSKVESFLHRLDTGQLLENPDEYQTTVAKLLG